MRASGIVKRIDNLGRIVIPEPIREGLEFTEGTPIEIYYTEDSIILKKYKPFITHKVERVDNLMYEGCEPHWHCIKCGEYYPFHCYTREQLELQECKGE